MGYYSNFDWEILEKVKVDKKKAMEVEKYFSDYSNDDVYGFCDVKFEYDDNGYLIGFELDEYYSKFYDDKLFAIKLAECIIDGEIILKFVGEDGIIWGYKVMPKKVVELDYIPKEVNVVEL